MLENLAGWIAARIKNVVPEHPASYAVLKFAVSIVLNVILVVGCTLLISVITGKAAEAVLILISFALLRQVSGGVHLRSGLGCVLFTTVLFTALSYVQADILYVQLMNSLSLLLVLLLAPIGIDKQTRIPAKHWPKLKFIAAALVVTNIFIASPVIAGSFMAQAVSLVIVWKKGSGSHRNISAQSRL
ncbi:accessory gene regulator ArgB-like protein [Paenibacillus pedocola]|uniref:accessory gene regulator ArgB-like protein n=1 Tax=Paenibacillus pedocola TaxID=3242193 RepID=UPI002877EFCA|nr:accessory gene regulator B family protein [Paenibacillus typhae]